MVIWRRKGKGAADLEGVIRACRVLLWPISLHTVDLEKVLERPRNQPLRETHFHRVLRFLVILFSSL